MAIDRTLSRPEMARNLGAEAINFRKEDSVEALRELTGGIRSERIIYAVGTNAESAEEVPAAESSSEQRKEFDQIVEKPDSNDAQHRRRRRS